MSYKVSILKSKEAWDASFSRLPKESQDIYMMYDYYQIDNNHTECFFVESDQNIFYYPYVKEKVNTLGYELDDIYYDIQGAYGYNGALTNCDDIFFLKTCRKLFIDYCMSENVIAEFVRFNPILKNHKLFADMEILNINKNIILDLTEENIWMNSYEHSTRKNVNKAIRNNLSVKIINSVDISDYDISTFHNIYINTMERNSAMNEYYYSKDFFKKFKTLLPKNSFYIFVYKDEKVISVELVLFNRYIAYSFLGGTLPEYFQYRPNDFLKHNIIEKLLKLNLSYFNFGGGAKPEDGVFKYKKNFAKNGVYDFYIGKKIYNQKIYDNVVSQWKGTFKDQVDSYENLLLCYRYTS